MAIGYYIIIRHTRGKLETVYFGDEDVDHWFKPGVTIDKEEKWKWKEKREKLPYDNYINKEIYGYHQIRSYRGNGPDVAETILRLHKEIENGDFSSFMSWKEYVEDWNEMFTINKNGDWIEIEEEEEETSNEVPKVIRGQEVPQESS